MRTVFVYCVGKSGGCDALGMPAAKRLSKALPNSLTALIHLNF
jgi:hypothetical protein